jgi:hypothetical protein
MGFQFTPAAKAIFQSDGKLGVDERDIGLCDFLVGLVGETMQIPEDCIA